MASPVVADGLVRRWNSRLGGAWPLVKEDDVMLSKRWLAALSAAAVGLAVSASDARADHPNYNYPNRPIHQFYYYPYYYFPHNYWPNMQPQWPEKPGMPYQRPPAYMAYPPFLEPGWRYDLWQPHNYYRGFHYWLDQF
jgi:hypothetical protein